MPQYVLNLPEVMVGSLLVPSYFIQGKAGDDVFNVGHHANFGHPGTLAAFGELLKALANKFDNDPNFAFIQFIETSLGADPGAAQQENFLNGIMNMHILAKSAFATTPLIQSLNYPRKMLPAFINNLTNLKMGFGGPDSFTGSFEDPDDGLAFYHITYPGIYRYNEANYNDTNKVNKLPIGMQAHTGSMIYKTRSLELAGIRSFSPTEGVTAVYNFAIDRLHANFLTWQVFGSGDETRAALKAKLMAIQNQDPSPAGGLPAACPTIFDSCAGRNISSIDTLAPTSTITSPTAGIIVNDSATVTVDATDNVGVTRVELYANGVLIGTDTTAPYSFIYTAPQSVDIDVALVARTFDAAGNMKNSAVVGILVRNAPAADTILPWLSISNPNDGAIIPAWKSSIGITAFAGDNIALKNIKLFINGTLRKTSYTDKLSFEWIVGNIKAGTYKIRVEATDSSNNKRVKIIYVTVRQ